MRPRFPSRRFWCLFLSVSILADSSLLPINSEILEEGNSEEAKRQMSKVWCDQVKARWFDKWQQTGEAILFLDVTCFGNKKNKSKKWQSIIYPFFCWLSKNSDYFFNSALASPFSSNCRLTNRPPWIDCNEKLTRWQANNR